MDICRGASACKLIEDCAHAIETEYRGRKAGTFGDFGCFSFYVTKNVVTGEGGMVLRDERSRRGPDQGPGAARHDARTPGSDSATRATSTTRSSRPASSTT